jgi:HEPN domain-containing protein
MQKLQEANDGFLSSPVCFHAQQCIEKLLKAVLIQAGQTPPKTHDLLVLSLAVQTVFPEWQPDEDDLEFLNTAAVRFRYPGIDAEKKDAEEAHSLCERLRAKLLNLLAQ